MNRKTTLRTLAVAALASTALLVGCNKELPVTQVKSLLDDPGHALVILVFLLVYQQIENYVFAPKITARTMDLHPAVAFGTVMVGAALFGGVGALIALPAAAVIQAVASTYLKRHEVIDTHMTRDHGVKGARGAGSGAAEPAVRPSPRQS